MSQELDSFLIGDGSAKLMTGYVEANSFAHQIAVPDTHAAINLVNDVDDYADHQLEVLVIDRQEVDYAFHAYKKEVYDVFNYVELKSSWMPGVPIKVEDLVMDDADKYLIDYLINTVSDLYVWKQLAKLQACLSMGIQQVRWVSDHDCPVCRALTGKPFSTEGLLRMLCNGQHVTHTACPCDLLPVIHRESYEGVLEGHLDEPFVTWGVRDLINVPRELLADTELQTLVEDMHWLEVDFVSMPVWCAENDVEDAQGLVVHAEDETLYVHNSYVGGSTPVDYLRNFLTMSPVLNKLGAELLRESPSYWLDGQRVVKHNGQYYDQSTGDLVSIMTS